MTARNKWTKIMLVYVVIFQVCMVVDHFVGNKHYANAFAGNALPSPIYTHEECIRAKNAY